MGFSEDEEAIAALEELVPDIGPPSTLLYLFRPTDDSRCTS